MLCKFSAFSLEFQNFFSIARNFLTVGQNNFGNKIPVKKEKRRKKRKE